MRANGVAPPTGRGTVWISPASGLASISWTRRTSVAPGHHAVGVEHHEVAIAPSPAPAEVGDVAGLAAPVVGAIAVEQPAAGIEVRAQPGPQRLLGVDDLRLAAVAQDEQLEMGQLPGVRERAVDRRDADPDLLGILVMDRHHERRSRRASAARPPLRKGRSHGRPIPRQKPAIAVQKALEIQAKLTKKIARIARSRFDEPIACQHAREDVSGRARH